MKINIPVNMRLGVYDTGDNLLAVVACDHGPMTVEYKGSWPKMSGGIRILQLNPIHGPDVDRPMPYIAIEPKED